MFKLFCLHFISIFITGFYVNFSVKVGYCFDVDQVIEVESGSAVELKCPNHKIQLLKKAYQREDFDNQKDETTVTVNGENLVLQNVTYVYTGLHNCSTQICKRFAPYNIPSFSRSANISPLFVRPKPPSPCRIKTTNIYLYVKDENVLSLVNPKKYRADLTLTQYEEAIIPCRPTSLDVQVELFIGTDLTNQKKIILNKLYDGTTYTYSSMEGFKTNDTKFPGIKLYTCNFTRNGKYEILTSRIIVKPHVTSIPSPVVHSKSEDNTVGKMLIVECKVETNKMVTIEWITPQTLKDERIQNLQEIKHSSASNLIINWFVVNEIERKDGGYYYCKANNNDEFSINSEDVFIYDVDEKYINFIENYTTEDLWSNENGTTVQYKIRFDANPKPSLFWMKDGENLTIFPRVFAENESTEAVLTIKNVSASDFGNYTLLAKNEFKTKSISFVLNFTSEPHTKIEVVDIEQNLIKCISVAHPKAKIRWFYQPYDGNIIEETPREIEEIESKENGVQTTSKLRFDPAWRGWLRCFSENSLGSQFFNKLVIGERNKKLSITSDNNVTFFQALNATVDVRVDETAVFDCVVPVKLYNNDLKWFHKNRNGSGRKIEQDDTKYFTNLYRNVYMFSMDFELIISNTSKEDDGIYGCQVSKESGGYEFGTFKLNVGESDSAPSIINDNNKSDIEASAHSDVTLECNVIGFPTPSITWLLNSPKGDIDIIATEKTSVLLNFNQTLVLKNVTHTNGGTYICNASNTEGSTIRKIKLIITDKSNVNSNEPYWIIIILVLFLLVTLVFTILRFQREKKLRKQLKHLNLDDFEKGLVKNINPEMDLCDQANLLPYDKKWEIQLDDLKLGQQLGSGAFGVVLKGELRNFNDKDYTTVAVKKVNKSSSFECLKALASELKIMIHLGQHVNIVNLIGACTKNIGKRELYVVVEYCRFGNIQHYLLTYKENFINQINPETGKYDSSLQRVISRKKNVSLADQRPKSNYVRYVPSPTSDREIKEQENSDSSNSFIFLNTLNS